jgi:hypothetical protein
MEVGCQLHAPAALVLGKEPLVPTGYETGLAVEPVKTLWIREKSVSFAGVRTPAVQPAAHRYTT